MNARKIRQISVLPPLQRETLEVVPNSKILGGADKIIDVVGTKLGALIDVKRVSDDIVVYDGLLRVECTDSKKVKITNADGAVVLAEGDATSADVVVTSVQGLKITIKSGLTGVTIGDIADIYIVGDSTYIIPGTIMGRIKDENSDYFHKWMPVGTNLDKFDAFRVCGGTLETNKERLMAPASNTMITADNFTTDGYVFAEVIESVCRSINLTDEIKAKMTGIVWC